MTTSQRSVEIAPPAERLVIGNHDAVPCPKHETLFTEEEADAWAEELRELLAADLTPETRAAIESDFGREIWSFGGWYQRITFDDRHVSTTSDHPRVRESPGSLNRLGGRLTPHEASILRPMPKWKYIERLLPDLAGKSVLELGSSNGFFSLAFASLGAERVLGLELLRGQVDAAQWAAKTKGLDHVEFRCTDALLDRSIEPHDIVFLSEVHNHFPLPFYGLLRVLNLAKELVVFDNSGVIAKPEQQFRFQTFRDPNNRRISFTHCTMSEGLLMHVLDLFGVPVNRVRAFKSPLNDAHVLYLIDTSNLQRDRLSNGYPECLRDFFDRI
ncbi:MAG: class I SAM-dependent methyltransferase [Phycisphaerales bacterium]|jgi:2-polyprenyl-3-methyl-5-hydroxy-6-metoxy-1,4-benzoquinol methylase